MKFGAVFPHLEIGTEPATIRDWARAVEEAGYTHVLAYDHVLGADPGNRPDWTGYTHRSLFHEVFVLFGYLAAITTELELTTGVLVLTQRQTALVAKQAAEVDLLSRGRLRLGVGIGWNHVEYRSLGIPFDHRGARLTEQVELLRKLWTDPVVTHQGRFDRVEEAGLNPLPGRKIPIWFGGEADAVLQRTAQIGDGWMPQGPPGRRMRHGVDHIRRMAERAGRDPEGLGVEARLSLAHVPERHWRAYVDEWRKIGATHLCVNTMDMGLTSPDLHAQLLRDVLPRLSSD